MKLSDFKEKYIENTNASSEKSHNLGLILEVVKKINKSLSLEEVLETVLSNAIKITGTERGFIVLKNKSGELEYHLGLDFGGTSLGEENFDISESVVDDVFESGNSKFIEDAQSDLNFSSSKSIFNLSLQTIFCAPLIVDRKKIGVLYVDSQKLQKINMREITFAFEVLAGQAAIAIQNAQMYKEQIQSLEEMHSLNNQLYKAKEEAEKSNKFKSEFLAQMSHEIRTPISTIISFTSLLQEQVQDNLPEDFQDTFTIVNKAGRRIIRTIDTILEMSQLQSGNIDFNPEKFDLAEQALEGIIDEFKYSAKEKNIALTFQNKSDNKPIYADKYMTHQIFQNLIDNALKYTLEGSIEITQFNDYMGKIAVTVKDSGVGMSKEYMNNLFSPFMQEESGYTRKFEGNGLGLAIVKKYIDLNSASIDVKSEKDTGSAFTVTFLK